jgi:riboflavin-specific deaminase-like protein
MVLAKVESRRLKAESSHLPFVLINMAMTADGKIATANRAISSFGSRLDHDHLLELRATADAVIAGARTVDSNRINLGPGPARCRRWRLNNGLAEYNLRVIVSGSGTINPNAEVFKRHFSPVIILTSRRAGKNRLAHMRAVADEVKICGEGQINFRVALRWLREQWGVKRLLCEGGGELNDALFQAGVVDEVHLTICPKVFGGRSAPTIAEGTGVTELAAATQLQLKSTRQVGDELFLVYMRLRAA